jgi:homogentisate phytyltransferase/homogentisate geranylgeranyltransferase
MMMARGFVQAVVLLCGCIQHSTGFSSHSLSLYNHRQSSPRRPSFQSFPRLSLKSQTQQSSLIQEQAATPAAELIQTHIVEGIAETRKAADAAVNKVKSKPSFPVVLWRFTRPHTLIGSALAIPSLHLLAAPSLASALQPSFWYSVLFCTLPSLLMNLYITGLNQITDVDIDKINKPDLPIAAGILSKRNASIIVITSLITSLYMGTLPWATQGLRVALWGSGILGTMYSLEPFRLKQFPLLAAFCIVAVRGTIINASFYAHAKHVNVLQCLTQDPACVLSSLFYCVFGVVIALMKDVPDVAGDVSSNVKTFSVRLGQKRIFHLGKNILIGLFGAFAAGFVRGAVTAPTTALTVCRALIGAACLGAATSVQTAAQNVNPLDSRQVYEYYMHLWKWFYLSYLALPFAR